MNRYSIYIFQATVAVISVALLKFQPLPGIWLDILSYMVVICAATHYYSRFNNKRVSRLKKEAEELKKELDRFNLEIQVSSSQVSSVSEQLFITLDENNAFAQQLFAETKDMAALNVEVTGDVEGTISVVKSMITLLEDARSISGDLDKTSSASGKAVKNSLGEILEIVRTINEIKLSTDSTMAYMNKLTNTSKQIAGILETVTNVAKQTQLLALNASIESARAGEAGRGFRVVAEEIGKLAQDTSSAVKDVNNLITGIQDEITNLFRLVNENTKRVQDGVRLSRNIENNLEDIDTSFGNVYHFEN